MNGGKFLNYVLPVFFILLFAAISTFVPRELVSYVFILYIVLFFILIGVVPRIIARKKRAKITIEGSVLIRAKQSEVLQLINRDSQLSIELKSQFTRMFAMMFLPLLIWFALSFALASYILPTGREGYTTLEIFGRYVLFYSILFGILNALRFVLTPKKTIIPIMDYEIRSNGIIGSGGIVIPFPLDTNRYSVNIDYRRSFLEIYDKKTKQAYRFYVSDPFKVKSIIERYGLKSSEAQATLTG